MEGIIILYIFVFKALKATNCTFMEMLVLTVLALAVVADGYRFYSPSLYPMDPPLIQTTCYANGANYAEVENATTQFVSCMKVDFQVKMFQSELKEALTYHTYDAFNKVFKKYCRKSPELKACYHKLVDAMALCFGNNKQAFSKITNKMMDQILNYLCENDGNIITKFIMEGGPQCFEEKTDDIMMCIEMSKRSILKMEQSSALSATNIRIYDDLLKCVLRSVESCRNPIFTRIAKRVGEIDKQIISEETRNPSHSATTEQELDHVNDAQHASAVVADGYRLNSQSLSPMDPPLIEKTCYDENASVQFFRCMNVDFHMKMFQSELKEALTYHTYEYDAFYRIFKKYCHKRPELKACYHKLVDVMALCFDNNKETFSTITNKMMDQILNNLCENDGYIMTKFFVEGGQRCFEEKTDDISICIEISKSSIADMESNSDLSATKYIRVYDDFLKCVLRSVETCQNPISTRIVKRVGEVVKQINSEETRNPFHNATTEQVLDHVNDAQRESVESEHGNNLKKLCENNEAVCKTVQASEVSENITTEKVFDRVNENKHESDRSDDDMSNKLQKLCEKNGVYFKAVQAVGVQSVACMEDIFGIKMLGRELEEAQNSDSYAKIFKRYCPRAPLLKTCIHTLIYGVSPCFGDDAEYYRTTTMNAYDGVIDYVCQDDGYRMAKFFAEGNLQCLKNKSHDIKTCAENSKNSFLQGRENKLSVMQMYELENQLMNCILKSAASCEPAAAKTLESVAEIIRNAATTSHETKKKLPEKTTRSLVKASGTVVLAFNFDIFV